MLLCAMEDDALIIMGTLKEDGGLEGYDAPLLGCLQCAQEGLERALRFLIVENVPEREFPFALPSTQPVAYRYKLIHLVVHIVSPPYIGGSPTPSTPSC